MVHILTFLLIFFTHHVMCESKTTFVPLQVTYDPVFEQALNYYKQKDCNDSRHFFAANFFVQTTTAPLSKYFMVNNKKCLNVQEDGSGDVDSLWFQVISSDPTFYRSRLRMKPQRIQTGAIFTGSCSLSCISEHLQLAFNTALIYAQTRVNLTESHLENVGTVPGFLTLGQSFANPQRSYAQICSGSRSKTGLDDIQLKILYDFSWSAVRRSHFISSELSPYFLLGIPTGTGTKGRYLFEPLVGSKHVNIGLGATGECRFHEIGDWTFSLLGEAKWRYACAAHETRVFDLCRNGQWSRYMLVVRESDKFTPLCASNDLALRVRVVPRNNLNLWLAFHAQRTTFNVEAGYGLTCRQSEKITLSYPSSSCLGAKDIGIADLPGIAALAPQSASTGTIAQAVQPGINPIRSDAVFTPITIFNVNSPSAEQPQTISNKLYASLGYDYPVHLKHSGEFTFSISYEQGNKNALSQFALWLGSAIHF